LGWESNYVGVFSREGEFHTLAQCRCSYYNDCSIKAETKNISDSLNYVRAFFHSLYDAIGVARI